MRQGSGDSVSPRPPPSPMSNDRNDGWRQIEASKRNKLMHSYNGNMAASSSSGAAAEGAAPPPEGATTAPALPVSEDARACRRMR